MKAKEIAKRIQDNFGVDGADAFTALSVELVADVLRFNEDVKVRKIGVNSHNEIAKRIGLQAWMRLANEYNTKWRSVMSLLTTDPRFCHEGRPGVSLVVDNFFLAALVTSLSEGLPQEHIDATITQILAVSTTPASAKFDIQRSVWRMQEKRDMRETLRNMMFGTLRGGL